MSIPETKSTFFQPKRWLFFISRRYVMTRRRNKSNTASLLSIGGLALGCMVLIGVISVMNAFQLGTMESILAINSFHIRSDDAEITQALKAQETRIRKEIPEISTLAPFQELELMAYGRYGEPSATLLRGMRYEDLLSDPLFNSHITIVSGTFNFTQEGTVVLGYYLARTLGVQVGDTLKVLTFSSGKGLARAREQSLKIVGLMEVGYREYDQYWGLCSLETAQTLGADGQALGIRLINSEQDGLVTRKLALLLQDTNGIQAETSETALRSWRDYNSALYGALRVEKLMMMLIVGLIFIVVGVNIFHALRRSVLEKTEDIGILRALGAGPGAIRMIFVGEGLIVGSLGAGLGLLGGILLSNNIDLIFKGLEQLSLLVRNWIDPSLEGQPLTLFYLDHVPSHLIPAEALGIALFAWACALFAAWAASGRISKIQPAEILRNE